MHPLNRSRAVGLFLGGVAGLLFVIGLGLAVAKPTPTCPPPRQLLCEAEGLTLVYTIVQLMWLAATLLLIAAVVLLIKAKRQLARQVPVVPEGATGPADAAPRPQPTNGPRPPGPGRPQATRSADPVRATREARDPSAPKESRTARPAQRPATGGLRPRQR